MSIEEIVNGWSSSKEIAPCIVHMERLKGRRGKYVAIPDSIDDRLKDALKNGE